MEIELGGERAVMLPPAGLFLPDRKALLVADLHLGKGAAFRAAGRPVPAGTSRETLERVAAVLAGVSDGTSLWVLGDLFHGPTGATTELDQLWGEWRTRHPSLDVALVHGNHDRRLLDVARRWECQVVAPPVRLGRLELRHEPRGRSATKDECWGVAGHLHPVVRLREGRRSGFRLPCFWLRGRELILPAVGALVDGARLECGRGDRVFVPAGNQVLEIPPAQLPSSARAG